LSAVKARGFIQRFSPIKMPTSREFSHGAREEAFFLFRIMVCFAFSARAADLSLNPIYWPPFYSFAHLRGTLKRAPLLSFDPAEKAAATQKSFFKFCFFSLGRHSNMHHEGFFSHSDLLNFIALKIKTTIVKHFSVYCFQ